MPKMQRRRPGVTSASVPNLGTLAAGAVVASEFHKPLV